MHPDLVFHDLRPSLSVGNLVLCGFRVWSAYKCFGHADGAIMLSVNSSRDIADEFDSRMMEMSQRKHRFFGIREPNRWLLRWYLPYCDCENF